MAAIDCLRYMSSIPPFSLLNNPDVYQCLMFGMEGAGKTTLLYKLKCPNWKKEQVIKEIRHIKKTEKDPAYHYEEFPGTHGIRFGIWDIPGDEIALNMGNMFYKYLRIHTVFFVVDTRKAAIQNVEKMEATKRLFEFLLNEDELRSAAFILVYNCFDDVAPSSQSSPGEDPAERFTERRRPEEQIIREILGVQEVKECPQHKHRFFEKNLNCADVDRNEWSQVVDNMRHIIKDSEM